MNFDFFRTGVVQGIQEFFYFDPGTFKKNRFFKFYEFPIEFFVLEKKIIFGSMGLVHVDLVQRYIMTGESNMAAASLAVQ